MHNKDGNANLQAKVALIHQAPIQYLSELARRVFEAVSVEK